MSGQSEPAVKVNVHRGLARLPLEEVADWEFEAAHPRRSRPSPSIVCCGRRRFPTRIRICRICPWMAASR